MTSFGQSMRNYQTQGPPGPLTLNGCLISESLTILQAQHRQSQPSRISQETQDVHLGGRSFRWERKQTSKVLYLRHTTSHIGTPMCLWLLWFHLNQSRYIVQAPCWQQTFGHPHIFSISNEDLQLSDQSTACRIRGYLKLNQSFPNR